MTTIFSTLESFFVGKESDFATEEKKNNHLIHSTVKN